MSNDTRQLLYELELAILTILPNTDSTKLKLRFEEIIQNYEITKTTEENIENDLQEKIDLYLHALTVAGFSIATITNYKEELKLFSNHLQKPSAQVTTADIRIYLTLNPNLKNSTIAKKLSVIKAFFTWMVREELLLHNPALKIRSLRQENRLPKALTPLEMETVRNACLTLRERAFVEVFFSTGCRLSEVSGMKKAAIEWDSDSIAIIGKGNKERVVYLSPTAIFHLKAYFDSCDYEENSCEYVFSTVNRPHRQLNPASTGREIKHISDRVSISKSLTPHVFRHTMATISLNNGIELADLQSLLGHVNPSTTLRYAKISEDRKQNAHKKFVH